jgi:hypothetical protein
MEKYGYPPVQRPVPERRAAMPSFRARNSLKLICLFTVVFILSLWHLNRNRDVWVSDKEGFTKIPRPSTNSGVQTERPVGAKSEEWLVPMEAHIMYV